MKKLKDLTEYEFEKLQELVQEMFSANQDEIYDALQSGMAGADQNASLAVQFDSILREKELTTQMLDDLEIERDNYRAIAKSRYEEGQRQQSEMRLENFKRKLN